MKPFHEPTGTFLLSTQIGSVCLNLHEARPRLASDNPPLVQGFQRPWTGHEPWLHLPGTTQLHLPPTVLLSPELQFPHVSPPSWIILCGPFRLQPSIGTEEAVLKASEACLGHRLYSWHTLVQENGIQPLPASCPQGPSHPGFEAISQQLAESSHGFP